MARGSVASTVGQLLVVGFEGSALPRDVAQALGRGERAGVILFKRNLPDITATLALNAEVIAVTPGSSPLIGVDHEGGRVLRLPAPVLRPPAMRRLGELGDLDLIERVGELVGRQLRALGFNVNFAPVLDVDSNPLNPVIGDRAFASTPGAVVSAARAYAVGLMRSGVMACGKHFPGHGDTVLDSHLELPRIGHDRERLDAIELHPFAELASELPALMSAHVVFDALAPGTPATLSPAVCTALLRNDLGFGGLLFSDDFEMRALEGRYPVEESAVAAIGAGCDALLLCRRAELADRAFAALVKEAESSPTFLARCDQAADRVDRARRRWPARVNSVALDLALASPEVTELQARLDAMAPPGSAQRSS